MTFALQADELTTLLEGFRNFVARHWTAHQDLGRWQAALQETGWHCADWPAEHGGPGLDAVSQWLWARAWADGLAPLPGEEISRLAPLLLALGTGRQQKHLEGIRAGRTWRFVFPSAGFALEDRRLEGSLPWADSANLCVLVDEQLLLLEADALMRHRQDDGRVHLAGYRLAEDETLGSREASRHLALHQSPFCNLLTQLRANRMLEARLDAGAPLGQDADGKPAQDLPDPLGQNMAEIAIHTRALEAMFLRDLAPALLNLKFADVQGATMELMSSLMGYYRLLEPAAGNTGNEPELPWAAERQMLGDMQKWAGVNQMVQKDQLSTPAAASSASK